MLRTRRVFLMVCKLVLYTFCSTLAMPPHPDLADRIKKGEVALPALLLQLNHYQDRGINSPTYHPNNSLSKKKEVHLGELKPLVLLVDFPDNSSQVHPAFFDTLVFSLESNSVRDYYREISYGNLDIIPITYPSEIGWFEAPQTYQYYANHQNGLGNYPQNSQKLVEDLVELVDSAVDFSQYDSDLDGFVDALIVVHSGTGAEFSGSPDDIWSHKWSVPYPFKLSDEGVGIKHYTMQPEYWQWANDMTIGVFCHELGHILGLPDLYDIDGDSKGIGEWSLMAYGSWNGPLGSSPAHPDAWSRFQLGFADPILISDNSQAMAVPAIEEFSAIYRLWTYGESGNEYFLIENRQKIGYDSYLPGSGLLIWHIDESMYYNNYQWYPGYTHNGHYKVALKQADGLWQLEKNINRGDGGDPFPGSSANFDFNSTSSPNSNNYLELGTHVGVNNISSSASIITCDFLVKPLDVKDEVKQSELPDFTLKQNFPNPFNSSTTISFSVHSSQRRVSSCSQTNLVIYNILGQKVRTLFNEVKPEGDYEAIWDGRDDAGVELPSGLYFYRLKSNNSQKTKKMILLK